MPDSRNMAAHDDDPGVITPAYALQALASNAVQISMLFQPAIPKSAL